MAEWSIEYKWLPMTTNDNKWQPNDNWMTSLMNGWMIEWLNDQLNINDYQWQQMTTKWQLNDFINEWLNDWMAEWSIEYKWLLMTTNDNQMTIEWLH